MVFPRHVLVDGPSHEILHRDPGVDERQPGHRGAVNHGVGIQRLLDRANLLLSRIKRDEDSREYGRLQFLRIPSFDLPSITEQTLGHVAGPVSCTPVHGVGGVKRAAGADWDCEVPAPQHLVVHHPAIGGPADHQTEHKPGPRRLQRHRWRPRGFFALAEMLERLP